MPHLYYDSPWMIPVVLVFLGCIGYIVYLLVRGPGRMIRSVTVVLNGRELLKTSDTIAELIAHRLSNDGWTLEMDGDILFIERGHWRRRIDHHG